MNRYTLLKEIRSKKLEAKKILDACESRDMTEAEEKSFNDLNEEVVKLRAKMSKLSLLEEGGDDEEEDEDEERSAPPARQAAGRQSRPFEERTAPAIHTRPARPYSILRALRMSLEAKEGKGRGLDGLEAELSAEMEKRMGKPAQGFYMPMGSDPEMQALMAGKEVRTTTIDTSAGTGAVFVSPQLPFIELLRSKMVTKALGATFLSGMEGKFSIPRQSGSTTAGWVTESSSVTAVNQTLDQVAFVDKTLGAGTTISRKFLYQSSIDAEEFVKEDLALTMAIELDRAAVNGSGSGAVPTGILQNSTIITNSGNIQGGTNGLAPTFAQMVSAETLVANNNAARGSLKYLTTPAAKGKLKNTVKAGTFPVYIWENDEINGYPAMASNQLPSNLTKGSSSGVCSSLIFGNWNDLVIAQWGGVDVVINPFTGQLSGAVTISMLMEADVEVRHVESFAIITDLLTS